MDIDEQGDLVASGDTQNQIILPGDALPGIIHLIPQDTRPFFPGQAVPLVMDAQQWMPTFESLQSHKQEVVGLLATKDTTPIEAGTQPHAKDLYQMGTVCRIHRIIKEGDQLQVLLEGLQRFKVRKWSSEKPPLMASVQYFPDRVGNRSNNPDQDEKPYAVAIINTIKELIPLNPLYGEELKVFLARSNLHEPSLLADFAASLTTASKSDLQDVLETLPIQRRMELVLELLHKEVKVASAQMEIRQHVEKEIQEYQRDAVLKEQLKYIQQELGITKDDKTAELERFRARIENLELPPPAQQRVEEELNKLSLLEVGSAEYGVTRNYLEWLTTLPWGITSTDNDDLNSAQETLDEHHEGLADIKGRILEFLAVGIMKGGIGGSIICFVGPPGVGKTSLGRAIANALNRKFYRFSVGGMRDEAEIKGHRRTYIGAMPGKLIQALKDTEVSNPVVMLDEIDKIGASYQGDPASALLEVLDPEQNDSFHDHYLDVDFDLSKVLFICTANQLDSIPGPLLDRMEVIRLAGYLDSEKLAIARKHLLPRALKRAGLRLRGDVQVLSSALREIIDGYSREAGVRQLDKALAAVVRKSVVKILERKSKMRKAKAGAKKEPVRVGKAEVAELLGQRLYEKERRQKGIGVVTGLAWTAAGGATLPIESIAVHNAQPGLRLSGQLGDVMQESANIAYSFVRSLGAELGARPEFFEKTFLHIHVPAGATPKDGPSAGVTIATSLLSLARGKPIKLDCAMTGELTLTGQIYPVGGIREKLLAAKRQRIKHVILPAANERDYEEVPMSIREGIQVSFVAEFKELVDLVF